MASTLEIVGKRIRKARQLKKGMTQGHLAKQLSVTQATVSNWERGEADVGIDQLDRIAKVLGVPLRTLIEDAL